jgi:hypothetical protein
MSRCCRAARASFDSRVVEPGPPPIVTSEAITLIYNGADAALVYRTGVARFDRADPRRVLSRTGHAGLRSRSGLGKGRPGPQRRIRGRHGPPGRPMALLLRGR